MATENDHAVQQVTLAPQPTVYIRTTTTRDGYDAAFTARCNELLADFLNSRNLSAEQNAYARYHRFDDGGVDVELGYYVDEPLEGNELITAGELPGGEAIYVSHVGDLTNFGLAYRAGAEWLQANGRSARGVPWELYPVTPLGQEPDVWQIEIYWPLG